MAQGLGGLRPFKAVSLLIVLTLLLGSGLGFAAAAGPGAGDGTLHVARPGPGDRASYAGQEVILDPALAKPSGGRVTAFEVEWLPQTTFRTDQHESVEAMRVLQTFEWMNEITQHREAFYDVATHTALGDAGYGTYGDTNTFCTGVCINGNGIQLSESDEYSIRYTSYEPQRGPCGFLNSLHGRIVDEDVGFTEAGHCDTLTGHHVLDYRFIGKQKIAGYDAYGYEAEQVPGLKIWYADGIPFPVRFVTTFSDNLYTPYTYGRGWQMTLVDFTDGDAEYDWPEGPMIHDQGPVRLQDTTAWMVDDTGVDVGFPLSEAMQYLDRDAVSEEPILDWLERHPQAYMVDAWSSDYVDSTGMVQHYWWLQWSDGQDTTARAIVAHPLGPDLPVAEGPHLVNVYPFSFGYDEDRRYPPKALAPTRLPAIADLMTEYEERQDPAYQPEPPNRYGFSISCEDQGCSSLRAYVFAGHGKARSLVPYAPGFPGPIAGEGSAEFSHVAAWPDGRAMQEYAFTQASDGPAALVQPDDPADITETRRSDSRSAGIWALPTGEAAAGAGLLALVISALYYFWPVLKTLPFFSLFSRISQDKVLDNPNRAKVMQIVEDEPGIHFQQISRRTGMGRGALDHHLRKLADAGLVVPKVGAGYTCFFPKGVDRREMAAAGVTKSPGARKVFEVLLPDASRTVQDIAVLTGLSPSTVSHHLSRMKQAGVIEGGGRSGYRALVPA